MQPIKTILLLLIFTLAAHANIPSQITNTPFAKVITESKANGTTIAYTYGNALLSDGKHSFLADALGSTRGLVDSTGTLTDSYDYTPYGELSSHNGTSENSFLFTGEQRDAETEDYYLRARYYSPSMSHFLSRDTYDGKLIDPISQNHYLYAGGNPVMYVDPSGHMGMMSMSNAIAITGILAATVSYSIWATSRDGYGGNIYGILASYDLKLLSSEITIFGIMYMAKALSLDDAKAKQEEYDRFKNPCDNDPKPEDFGKDYCAYLKAAIAHKKQCIEMVEEWDKKWNNGRHEQKIRDFKRTLKKLEKKLKKQGRICE